MYAPAQHDEITGIANYLDQQLDAIRSCAYGLTEDQGRQTPCHSALSIGGILKHVCYVLRSATGRLTEGPREDLPDESGYADFMGSFALTEEESTGGMLVELDRLRPAYLDAIRAADPGAESIEPPAPWDGRMSADRIHLRYYLLHQLEELARHAGHADIIREQLDGALVPALERARAGAPPNDFFPAFTPEPGTITR